MYDDLLIDTFEFIGEMKTSEFEFMKRNIYYDEIEKGEMIFGTHDRCEGIPMVLKGSLRLFRTSDEGREMTSYYILPGSMCILAAVCTMGKLEYDFAAQADEDTLMAVLRPEGFRHMVEISREFRGYVFSEMAGKLISSFSLIEDIKFTKVEDRIMNFLESAADEKGEISITHEMLAVNIGSVREVVSRQLKKMEKKGMLSVGRGKIRLEP